jgi:hypothetical protein
MGARPMRMMAAALVMALAACGPSGTTSAPGRGNARLLTEDELGRASVNNVFDAVQRLRPAWLLPRYAGGTRGYPAVFVGSQRYGELEALRTLETANVREVHYFDAVDASSRFGRNVPFGVIQVILDVGG